MLLVSASLFLGLIVEGIESGTSLIVWDGKEGQRYQIELACLTEVEENENRAEALHVLDTQMATGLITFTPVEEVKAPLSPQTHALTAEVFVDLGDGRQSINEAQLLASQARLRKDANPQNCPRLEAMKKAEQEAKDSKASVWATQLTD